MICGIATDVQDNSGPRGDSQDCDAENQSLLFINMQREGETRDF